MAKMNKKEQIAVLTDHLSKAMEEIVRLEEQRDYENRRTVQIIHELDDLRAWCGRLSELLKPEVDKIHSAWTGIHPNRTPWPGEPEDPLPPWCMRKDPPEAEPGECPPDGACKPKERIDELPEACCVITPEGELKFNMERINEQRNAFSDPYGTISLLYVLALQQQRIEKLEAMVCDRK